MVRKIVAGMARMPMILVLGLVVLALGVVLALRPSRAAAATYVTPWWTVTAGVQEKHCANCSCEVPSPFVLPGVSVLTGELVVDIPITSEPTMLGSMGISLRWRSMISGCTEFGNGMIPSWMTTAEETIINVGNPLANGGTEVLIRLPTGGTVLYVWDGSAFTTTDCCFHDSLTKNGSNRLLLTALDGSTKLFDANGLPDVYTDANGNANDFTFNSSLQCTGWTNDRSVSATIGHDSNGWATSITLTSGLAYTMAYDSAGNLVSITSPTTPDQTSGIVIAPQYDSYNRLTSVTNGRSIDPYVYSYVGSTSQVSYATGSTITFSVGRLESPSASAGAAGVTSGGRGAGGRLCDGSEEGSPTASCRRQG